MDITTLDTSADLWWAGSVRGAAERGASEHRWGSPGGGPCRGAGPPPLVPALPWRGLHTRQHTSADLRAQPHGPQEHEQTTNAARVLSHHFCGFFFIYVAMAVKHGGRVGGRGAHFQLPWTTVRLPVFGFFNVCRDVDECHCSGLYENGKRQHWKLTPGGQSFATPGGVRPTSAACRTGRSTSWATSLPLSRQIYWAFWLKCKIRIKPRKKINILQDLVGTSRPPETKSSHQSDKLHLTFFSYTKVMVMD